MSRRLTSLAFAVLALGALPAGAAKPKPAKGGDIIWIHPAYASLAAPSIAFLPTVAYDRNAQSEKTVENIFPLVLRSSGYRWISPTSARDRIRETLGDSALLALHAGILKNARTDSLGANRVCRALRVAALLSTRVDLFEQVEVEWNQSGKPSTAVQGHAALVDSTGRLLWSAAGSETAEGQYHDPNAATVGVKGSGLDQQPITAQSGAPSFDEVATRLFTRWGQHFPPLPSAPPAAAAPSAPASPSPAATPATDKP
jgi:hypothetical protein